MTKANAAAVDRLLSHHVVEVINRAHLRSQLLQGKPLRVKLGFDPTAPDLHLGHAVLLQKLRAFQDLGHTVVFIVGDATARIGDPSGRVKARPSLTDAEIAANAQTYLTQVGKIVYRERAEVRRNSEWLDALHFSELLRLLAATTVSRVLDRDDFTARRSAGAPISLHELVYPLLQGYDSVAIRADVELGGTDQTLNLLLGRDLQAAYGQPPQDLLIVPLLVGLDGKEKMSKSLGNYVGITETPDSMVGKLMTIPDAAISDYARLAADWSDAALQKLPARLKKENPRDVKLEVARDVVALYHGSATGKRAVADWLRVFHAKELPKKIPTKKLKTGSWDVADLIVAAGLAASKSDARRLVAQGGVRLNGTRVSTGVVTISIKKGTILQVGKRKLVRVA